MPAKPFSLGGFSDEFVVNRSGLSPGFPADLHGVPAGQPDAPPVQDGGDPDRRPGIGNEQPLHEADHLDSSQERGLLDITLDPDFETNGHFYLYNTPIDPQRARITRFTHDENAGGLSSRGDLSSEFVVWQDTDGYLGCCHYGGGLDFGVDGKLWLSTSDKFKTSAPGEGNSNKDVPRRPRALLGQGHPGRQGRRHTRRDGRLARQPLRRRAGRLTTTRSGPTGSGIRSAPGGTSNTALLHRRGRRQPAGHLARGPAPREPRPARCLLRLALLRGDGRHAGQTPAQAPRAALARRRPRRSGGRDFFSSPIWSLPHDNVIVEANLSASLTGGEVYRGDMFPSEWDGVYFYGRLHAGLHPLPSAGLRRAPGGPGRPRVQALRPASRHDQRGRLHLGGRGRGPLLRHDRLGRGAPGHARPGQRGARDRVRRGSVPEQGGAPLTVTLDAVVSDADGDPMTWTVDFGDGTEISGAPAAERDDLRQPRLHVLDGVYDVSLSVSGPDASRCSRSPSP